MRRSSAFFFFLLISAQLPPLPLSQSRTFLQPLHPPQSTSELPTRLRPQVRVLYQRFPLSQQQHSFPSLRPTISSQSSPSPPPSFTPRSGSTSTSSPSSSAPTTRRGLVLPLPRRHSLPIGNLFHSTLLVFPPSPKIRPGDKLLDHSNNPMGSSPTSTGRKPVYAFLPQSRRGHHVGATRLVFGRNERRVPASHSRRGPSRRRGMALGDGSELWCWK